MTDKQPEALAFCWATELAMTQQPVTLSVTEAREVSAEMQRMHAENTALQQGYAAARLEIESLQARIKTMAEEHADELTVAHLDGRMRAAQPAGAQPAPELTETAVTAKNPAAPVSSFEDSRTQAVYEVLVNDNYPPAGSNEHWEGWKARLIVDALFPIEAPAAVVGMRSMRRGIGGCVTKDSLSLTLILEPIAMGMNLLRIESDFTCPNRPTQNLRTTSGSAQTLTPPSTQPASKEVRDAG